MSKLISNPTECGWRRQLFTRLGLPIDIYSCIYRSKIAGEMNCSNSTEFPSDCPLQDGIKKYQSFKELLTVTKKICSEEMNMSLLDFLKQSKFNNTSEELSDGSGLAQLRHDAEQIHTSLPGEYRNDLPGGKLVKKRRNRKNCKWYRNTIQDKNNCDNKNIMKRIPCIGVKCGCFKSE